MLQKRFCPLPVSSSGTMKGSLVFGLLTVVNTALFVIGLIIVLQHNLFYFGLSAIILSLSGQYGMWYIYHHTALLYDDVDLTCAHCKKGHMTDNGWLTFYTLGLCLLLVMTFIEIGKKASSLANSAKDGEQSMNATFVAALNGTNGATLYPPTSSFVRFADIQRRYRCCGFKRADEWKDLTITHHAANIPGSCCGKEDFTNDKNYTTCGEEDQNKIYKDGCVKYAEEIHRKSFTAILALICVTVVILALLIPNMCCLQVTKHVGESQQAQEEYREAKKVKSISAMDQLKKLIF